MRLAAKKTVEGLSDNAELLSAFFRDYLSSEEPLKNQSLFLWIFPLIVLGSSVRNSTILGYLYGAVWVLT